VRPRGPGNEDAPKHDIFTVKWDVFFLQAKCANYWTESSKAFGKITLTFQEKELFPYYVTRKFLIEKVGEQF
jgi:hypothetical protein